MSQTWYEMYELADKAAEAVVNDFKQAGHLNGDGFDAIELCEFASKHPWQRPVQQCYDKLPSEHNGKYNYSNFWRTTLVAKATIEDTLIALEKSGELVRHLSSD